MLIMVHSNYLPGVHSKTSWSQILMFAILFRTARDMFGFRHRIQLLWMETNGPMYGFMLLVWCIYVRWVAPLQM